MAKDAELKLIWKIIPELELRCDQVALGRECCFKLAHGELLMYVSYLGRTESLFIGPLPEHLQCSSGRRKQSSLQLTLTKSWFDNADCTTTLYHNERIAAVSCALATSRPSCTGADGTTYRSFCTSCRVHLDSRVPTLSIITFERKLHQPTRRMNLRPNNPSHSRHAHKSGTHNQRRHMWLRHLLQNSFIIPRHSRKPAIARVENARRQERCVRAEAEKARTACLELRVVRFWTFGCVSAGLR